MCAGQSTCSEDELTSQSLLGIGRATTSRPQELHNFTSRSVSAFFSILVESHESRKTAAYVHMASGGKLVHSLSKATALTIHKRIEQSEQRRTHAHFQIHKGKL